jgi:hypothetical protein
MTFGKEGEHRNHRSGGSYRRKAGEVFINSFQGKLAEFAFYEFLQGKEMSCPEPDISTYNLGAWDSSDFVVNRIKINIKSTKFYGNLILLETKDWNSNGEYIPNISTGDISKYDLFVLLRLKPDGEKLMRHNRFLYANQLLKEELQTVIESETWQYDIPGFFHHQELLSVISNRHIIPQNAMLNGTTRMDAKNYYVQAGDLHPANEIIPYLK